MITMSRLKTCVFVVTLVALVSLLGCKTVETKNLVGSAEPNMDKGNFEGIWSNPVGYPFYVHYKKDGKTLMIGMVGWDKEQETFKVGHLYGFLSKGQTHRYIYVRELNDQEVDTKGPFPLFGQYQFIEEDHLLIWPPDFDGFKKLLIEHELSGTASSDTVHLEDESQKLAEIIEAHHKDLFQWSEPMIFRRVHTEIDEVSMP